MGVFAPLVAPARRRARRPRGSGTGWRTRWNWPARQLLHHGRAVLTVVVLLGPLLAVMTFLHDFRRARLVVAEAFRHDATTVFGTLREEVGECVRAAASAADLLRVAGPVDRVRFGEFARPHLDRESTLHGILWAPRVPGGHRRDFETAARRALGQRYAILEPGTRGRPAGPAGPRAEYYPVLYRESQEGIEIGPVLGADLGAMPAELDALARARDSGEAAMTSVLRTAGGRQLDVYWSVYKRGEPHESPADRREALQGYVVAVFRLDAVMAYSLRQSMPGSLDIELVDEDASGADRLLAYPASPSPEPADSWFGSRLVEGLIRSPLRWQGPLEVAGRHWHLALRPTPSYVHATAPNDMWEDASVVLVGTSLLSAYLVLLIRRNDDVERQVAVRTGALQRALDQLVAEIADRTRAEATVRRLTRQILFVQEEERRRLSLELHDDVGQLLTALMMRLRLLQDAGEGGRGRLKASLREAEALARTALETVRSTARDLRPPALDTLGIAASLQNLCADVGRWANLPIAFTSPEIPPLQTVVAVCLYRVLQEALTNAAKYAGATRVDVALDSVDGSVVLSVEDDGRGFDPQDAANSAHAHGMGLVGMRERLELLGGTMMIQSVPGHGTRLQARLPKVTADDPATRTGGDGVRVAEPS